MMAFKSDIDIDFKDRNEALAVLDVTSASLVKNGKWSRHASGVYPTKIPVDPTTNCASIEYNEAEDRGYIKIDFLNMSVYSKVKSEDHLNELLSREPEWHRLYDREFCSKLMHIGNHYDTLIAMPEPVTSIPRLAMFLAIIRPAKRHLIGLPWKEVGYTIWDKVEGLYQFKKSHSLSYAMLLVVQMNLLSEEFPES